MAVASAVVSKDSLLCSICLSVFIKPVSIPCGHNFCLDCITGYWHTLPVPQCPLCKEKFYTRPQLRVNPVIAEMVEKVEKPVQEMFLSSTEQAGNEDVLCSICAGAKVRALKSCLMCLLSYCQTHLEPHQRILALKKHKLINPVKNLESRVCQDHGEPLELICRVDQMFLCESCKCGDHKTHKTVTLEDEAEMRKTQLRLENNSMDQMIQEHEQKIQEVRQSVKTSRNKAEEASSYSSKVMTALVEHIKTEFTGLSEAIKTKQKTNEAEAESFTNELERVITHMKKKKKLQFSEASLIRDPFTFLQNILPLNYNKPQLKDWCPVSVTSDQFMIQETMAELETTVREEVSMVCDISFRDGKQQRSALRRNDEELKSATQRLEREADVRCEQTECEHKQRPTEIETFYKEQLDELRYALKQKDEELKSVKYSRLEREADVRCEQTEREHEQRPTEIETFYKERLDELKYALKQKDEELKSVKYRLEREADVRCEQTEREHEQRLTEIETFYKERLDELKYALKQKDEELKSVKYSRLEREGDVRCEQTKREADVRCEQIEHEHKQRLTEMETLYKERLHKLRSALQQKDEELRSARHRDTAP
ncbi:E3 ubiquitin-protein ligase TRIM47-like isoform X12 [Simochromis diagramma]|uniref:E3 ubiquitin-protein ligase TRIM47-like isoform X12 n=1 Tax=Simochromis diagramma TaxID=43689 RepID=UPI001A7E9D4F|nr:E3 ubiquitin-protein ligase TRIM47-like isoform X12 [Simochromis diagramma]